MAQRLLEGQVNVNISHVPHMIYKIKKDLVSVVNEAHKS